MDIIDKELNEATQEKLAEYLPISPKAEFPYVPKAFRDLGVSEKPVFTLRGLTGAEEAECVGSQFTYGAYLCQAVRRGVVKWDNWGDFQFKEDYKKAGKLTDEAMGRFPYLLLVELGNIITNCSKLSEDELAALGS